MPAVTKTPKPLQNFFNIIIASYLDKTKHQLSKNNLYNKLNSLACYLNIVSANKALLPIGANDLGPFTALTLKNFTCHRI